MMTEYNPLSPFRLALFGGFCGVGGLAIGYAVYYDTSPAAVRIAYLIANLFWGIPIWAALVCFVTLAIRVWPRKLSPIVTESVTNGNETKTPPKGITREFYMEVARMSTDNENGLGRVKVFKGQLTDQQWREWVREPLVASQVAIRKNTVGGETAIWAHGWTPAKFAHWIEFGNLPPHPSGQPPKLDRSVSQDKEYKGNTGEYSADTADGATVYARDVM